MGCLIYHGKVTPNALKIQTIDIDQIFHPVSFPLSGKFLKVLDSATDTESVHNTLSELLPPSIYFRFNPYLSDVVRLDEASSEKLDRVQSETRAYLERNVEKVQFACKTLQKEKGFSKKISDWWYHNH